MAQSSTVMGGSNVFLTNLAAQERRVLELREELEKAENELSRLKGQWTQHEAVKKRNEFRHQEQLEQLSSANRCEDEVTKNPENLRASIDKSDRPDLRTAALYSVPCPNSIVKSSHLSNTRQTQRKIFAASRHTRALSLLSTSNAPQTSSSQSPRKPIFQESNAIRTSIVPPYGSHRSKTRSPVSPIKRRKPASEQPKEILMETGKQLVGDLRDGLWTFFEDLRQATVGEEASSTSNHSSSARAFGRHIVRMKENGKDGEPGMLHKTAKRLDKPQPSSTPRTNFVEHQSSQQQATAKEMRPKLEQVRPSKHQNSTENPSIESDEDECWDVWDTPVAKGSFPGKQSESVISESLASPSTSGCSPRSSMR
ncbi:MAG: hypothetical protein Q9196_001994 [Gyalolechia fulgens]